ncbi:hypothetical protein Rhow_005256 [Rhodococcus wratislaviensis]|uniref:Uncharacterized protein n=1 Tax=Rhodococcus wratislaviensis TaxID=44752 RepID=A0A402CDD1_RHOWR|nr:hypothetical protein Rhow_005256 [Rhodococcus wratislaviensis]
MGAIGSTYTISVPDQQLLLTRRDAFAIALTCVGGLTLPVFSRSV